MVSKNQIKLINALQLKKYRKQHQLFIAESEKVVRECIDAGLELAHLFVTQTAIFEGFPEIIISEDEMKKLSCLSTPSPCLAVFKIPEEQPIIKEGITVVLDDIRDPGNLGAIIRLCDWFGIQQIVCSKETVDVYNPKTVMASMGSVVRVQVNYEDLEAFLSQYSSPIYGTFMDGNSIYETTPATTSVLVFGNEANGISPKIEAFVTQKIAIPRFGKIQKTESLNVATATAIFLSEFRRNR